MPTLVFGMPVDVAEDPAALGRLIQLHMIPLPAV